MRNITNSILTDLGKNIIPEIPAKYLIKFYINNDLDKLLGDHCFEDDDLVEIVKERIERGHKIVLQTITAPSRMEITMEARENSFSVVGYMRNKNGMNSFSLIGNNEEINNCITFDEDDYLVTENSSVIIKQNDAYECRLSRSENNILRYSGALVDVGSQVNDNKYFDFKSFMPERIVASSEPVNKGGRLSALFKSFKEFFKESPVVKVRRRLETDCPVQSNAKVRRIENK